MPRRFHTTLATIPPPIAAFTIPDAADSMGAKITALGPLLADYAATAAALAAGP